MNRIYLLFLSTIAFILSGCYTTFETTGETYAQVDACIYINYDFYCDYCYYEMYWCPYCYTYHVMINHWCNYHYGWYNNWYIVYYYQPYGYYHNHWYNHYGYRDDHRHYVRDGYGIRNYGNREYLTPNGNSELKRLSGTQDIYKSPTLNNRGDMKRNDINLQKKYNEIYKDKSPNIKNNGNTNYNKPPVNRNNTIQKSPNTNNRQYQKPNVQKSNTQRNTIKRK